MSLNNHMSPGVHTAIEYPDRVAEMRRLGWGLYVSQEADPRPNYNNWFHIGIPYIASARFTLGSAIKKLYVQMKLNENARLAEIHLRGRRELLFQTRPNIIGGSVNSTYTFYKAVIDQPLTIAMRIEFLTGSPRGEVTFFGAGLQIDIA